jgi:hypothetical protein
VVNSFLLGNCNTMELTDCQSRHNCSSGLNSNSVRQRRFVNNFFNDKRHPDNLNVSFESFRELGPRQVSKLCSKTDTRVCGPLISRDGFVELGYRESFVYFTSRAVTLRLLVTMLQINAAAQ